LIDIWTTSYQEEERDYKIRCNRLTSISNDFRVSDLDVSNLLFFLLFYYGILSFLQNFLFSVLLKLKRIYTKFQKKKNNNEIPLDQQNQCELCCETIMDLRTTTFLIFSEIVCTSCYSTQYEILICSVVLSSFLLNLIKTFPFLDLKSLMDFRNSENKWDLIKYVLLTLFKFQIGIVIMILFLVGSCLSYLFVYIVFVLFQWCIKKCCHRPSASNDPPLDSVEEPFLNNNFNPEEEVVLDVLDENIIQQDVNENEITPFEDNVDEEKSEIET